MSEPVYNKLQALIDKWDHFLEQHLQANNTHPLTEHERGFLEGFATATNELRTLVAQLQGVTPKNRIFDTQDIEISRSNEENPPEWEYIYVSFEETPDGIWRVNRVNGVEQPGWDDALSFNEAVRKLRDNGGWRLTNYAKGIHVFRRPFPE